MPAAADEPPAAVPDASKTLAVRQLGAEGFMQAIIAAVENSSQKSKNTSEVRLAERLYLTIAEAAVLRTCYSRPESQCQNKIIPPG